MSVASQLPPEVFIPAAARTHRLRAVSSIGSSVPRGVDASPAGIPVAPAAAANGARVIDLDRWRHQSAGSAREEFADPFAHPDQARALAPVRLTRRGFAVLTAGAVVAALALVVFAWVSASASAPAGVAQAGRSAGPAAVTVKAGDSLWVIAREVAPSRDPRAEVAALRALNHLGSDNLTPGQSLRVR
jgi:hypothetical protein